MDFELAQESVKLMNKDYSTSQKMIDLCRSVGEEGCVLLKNDGVLPIKNKKVAVFGRTQINTFFTGYGSGGDVKSRNKVSLIEGIINAGIDVNKDLLNEYLNWTNNNIPDEGSWGNWPLCFEEMDVFQKDIKKYAEESEMAIVVIARSSGEDRDIKLTDGSWYLNQKERDLLKLVSENFEEFCVLINSGSIMDVSEILEFNPNALMLVWQGGQEMGNAVGRVLIGDVSPSGKLTSTIAKIEDFPSTKYMGNPEYSVYEEDIFVGYRYFNTFDKEKILYPFGYGLSYSEFEYKVNHIKFDNLKYEITFTVKNVGNYKGKQTIQFYLSKPNGTLSNPLVELVGYKKTKELNVLEEESYCVHISLEDFASFDDLGVTGYECCYVLENGKYDLYIGFDSINLTNIHSHINSKTIMVRKSIDACDVEKPFKRIANNNQGYEEVKPKKVDVKNRIINSIIPDNQIYDTYYMFDDVIDGKISLDEFVNSLTIDELEVLTRGSLYSMNSIYGPFGNAGTFGASCESLFKRNVSAISTNDGPSGVRLGVYSTLIPNGVMIASTFNDSLIEELGYEVGCEVKERNSHVLLAPGMNIHRNPLCGRNFEYYSEDPYLTGKTGASYVRGVQRAGVSASPKHFACNNQEFNRHIHNSIVSQRALREIYLKGFEICVKEGNPDVIMTSYNKINGEYAYYNFDLVNLLLRNEFGFSGVVITDWWMRYDYSKLFDNLDGQAYRIRAGVDVYMPGSNGSRDNPGISDGTLINSFNMGGITLSEIRKSAKRVLQLCIKYFIR